MITIKHKFTNATLCEFDVENLKQASEQGKYNLRGANLRGANLLGADLYGADLYGADLGGANLGGADLLVANLREADLGWANLREANLGGADLYGADLGGANLYGADLGGANLGGADLGWANLREADLREAVIDGETVSKNPIHITCGLKYVALITDNYMRLGCKRFTHDEWESFNDEEISEMDSGALEFWKQWKLPLLTMCKAHREVRPN